MGAGGASSRRRLRRIAIPVAALAIAAAATVPIGASSAHAAGLDPASAFINGDAQGVAQAVRIVPGIGSFEAAVAIGTSIAGYDDTEGQASAQNLNLGAVGTSLTGPQCDGSNPDVTATQVPQPLIAESPDGKPDSERADLVTDASNLQNTDGTKPGTQTVPASSPADAGLLLASTTGTPSGTASTQGGTFALGGIVTFSGASSAATAAVIAGNARDVTASASVGSIALAGGLVSLGNITETLHQRTGAGATSTGDFTIGSVSVAGLSLPVSPSAIASTIAAANAALAQTGLHITLPEFQKMPDGSVVETPLAIGLTDSPLGQSVVEPIVGGDQASAVTQMVENELIAESCQVGTAFSIGDLFVLNPATGAGSLNLLVGGLSAVSNGTAYADPFGSGGALGGGGVELGSPSVATPGTAGTSGTSGTSATAGSPGTAAAQLPTTSAAATSGTSVAQPQLATAASETVLGKLCDTTHLFRHPGCLGNHALPVGIAAFGVVVGLGYADAMAGRGGLRRRRGGKLDQLRL